MITQSEIHPNHDFEIFQTSPARLPSPEDNLYEDQEQLAAELAAPLPDSLVYQQLPEVDPYEFEHLHLWFLS